MGAPAVAAAAVPPPPEAAPAGDALMQRLMRLAAATDAAAIAAHAAAPAATEPEFVLPTAEELEEARQSLAHGDEHGATLGQLEEEFGDISYSDLPPSWSIWLGPPTGAGPMALSAWVGEHRELIGLLLQRRMTAQEAEGDRIQRGRHAGVAQVGGADYFKRLEDAKVAMIMEAVAPSTSRIYTIGWRHWVLFCRIRERSPVLQSETADAAARRTDEEELLLFIVHLAVTLTKAVSTIKQRLFGIKYQHVAIGAGDPLAGKPRVWLALRGLARRDGARPRKLPTTARMMLGIRAKYDPERNADHAAIWFALAVAWFYLMRVGEYAWSNGWDHDKVLCGADVAGRLAGAPSSNLSEADELIVWFKASKVDQLKAGEARNHYRTGTQLCPVAAAANLQRHFPERFTVDRHLPLCRWQNGNPIKREQLQEVLEQAAREEGLPPEQMRTHSLRIGGATALYHIYQDVELIKRFGRWSSNAFHRYLWEANEMTRGVAAGMAGDTTSLHVGYRLPEPPLRRPTGPQMPADAPPHGVD